MTTAEIRMLEYNLIEAMGASLIKLNSRRPDPIVDNYRMSVVRSEALVRYLEECDLVRKDGNSKYPMIHSYLGVRIVLDDKMDEFLCEVRDKGNNVLQRLYMPMRPADGIKQIDANKWEKDEYGVLNLYVSDARGREIHAWLRLRQHYCDRGHIEFNCDGPINLDFADSFPRYFFSFKEADEHVRTFLKWRLWKHRINPHVLEVE